ncbi:MAG TPA: protein kinase [Vicinamibacteria bacterium]|nr:protein kinase [Vicinamibacteria bacterium]
MVGQRLSHYEIERPLGAGGMGEVFLARDLALGRPVALKVLASSFRPDLRLRLLREAEATRRLQHPGIATFYESGEADATAFVAMEYVPGETLRQRLRAGPLPLEGALAFTGGLLEALVHAHANGIVHRDIKPENVMVMETGAGKLLDFGLALSTQLEARDSNQEDLKTATVLTNPGFAVGTAGYMPPEQLSGETVDARADLFAVGAVLYEMIAGAPAFPGATQAARFVATLSHDPAPSDRIGAELKAVLQRALARDRSRRYETASDFLRDLRGLVSGDAVVAYPEAVAVLDFANRSGEPEDAWIGAGIGEAIAADLARHSGLTVVPRARLMAEGVVSNPLAVARRLGCRWLVAGGYQRLGPAIRIVMELTEAPTDRIVATEKLDGRLEDMFALQDRLAQKAVEALAPGARAAPAPRRPPLSAYECYVRARGIWGRMTKGGFDEAQPLLEEAVRIEPRYADALAQLSALHDMRFTFTVDTGELERALDYASRALAIEPAHVEALVWSAYASWRSGKPDTALQALDHAIALGSRSHFPSYFAACVHMSVGRNAGAVPLYQEAVKLGPGFGFAWVGLGNALMETANLEDGEWALRRAVELESEASHATAGAGGYLGECLRRQGRPAAARAACLDGLAAAERSDHMYRDTYRAICLSVLCRAALDQGDLEAAKAAAIQCLLHLEGRPRALGCGPIRCQALAMLAAAGRDPERLGEARQSLERRAPLEWSWIWLATEHVIRADFERAARLLGLDQP